uniref:Acyl-CoA dehydrogenases-like protein n=2 Tax=unclassified Mycobacterium TaxID=2642494 RepID=A0A5Q5BJT0_MYCSS
MESVDFSYPQEAEQFRKDLRTWLSAHLTRNVIDSDSRRGADDDAFQTLRAWNATMADAGWAAVSWPSDYGGRDATPVEQLIYAEETTRARVPLPLNIIGMNNIAPAIMQYGTEPQKATLLSATRSAPTSSPSRPRCRPSRSRRFRESMRAARCFGCVSTMRPGRSWESPTGRRSGRSSTIFSHRTRV